MTEAAKTKPRASADLERERAIDKIRDEMAKNGGRYTQVVGDYLTGYLRGHPAAAGAILAKEKTIAGSLDAMRKEASKHKEGNVAVLDDETAFGIVLEYFGIRPAPSDESGARVTPTTPPPAGEDELSLDALLGL